MKLKFWKTRGPSPLKDAGRPHVVVVGGGFGGLNAARALGRDRVRITLIDRQNYHLFQPLLYQVATAALSPGDIASPIRWILRRQENVRVLMAEAERVEADRRVLVVDAGEIAYDFLILAPGATHSYFGNDEWARHAPGLKSLDDALEIRHRVLLAFERAERENREEERRRLLTFVVVGGGPTGVEMAGALAEISRHALSREFRIIEPGTARIILLEAAPNILSMFPESLQAYGERSLKRLGVDVRKGSPVSRVESGRLKIGDEWLAAGTVLWAAGVAASPLGRTVGAEVDRAGRVAVNPDLSVPGHPEVFVVGDLAAMSGPDGKLLPGLAAVAVQQARHAARNVRRAIAGRPMEPFKYKDRGSMATIGRAAAIADLGWTRMTGWFAWLIWLFVHIMQLTGFRNRLVVLVQWAWAYMTYQRYVRLIIRGERS
jgi:NADH:ubiquinone reductase (H+-translocating)